MDTTNTEIKTYEARPECLHYGCSCNEGPCGGVDLGEPLGEPIGFDPDLAVQLEIDAHDLGVSRGVRFRLAELADETGAIVDAHEAERSPCGIHRYPRPVAVCTYCELAHTGT